MITDKDLQFIKTSRVSIRYFILKMWGLTPQPVKPEFAKFITTALPSDIRGHMFGPFIKGKHYTWQQNLILIAIEKAATGRGPNRISVRSGHGIGKSTVMSWAILWFLFCWKDAQVPCTAPSTEQMHDILWKEVARWMKLMPLHFAAKYEWQADHIRMVESPETWFARAKTARKETPEALAGVHGDHVMFEIDEGSGVAEEVFNTAEGALTSGNILVLMFSNPTRLIGYFFDSHHTDSAAWQCLGFDSEESPIVDKQFVARIVAKHGIDSDEYKIRVKGIFPLEDGVDDQGYVPLLVEADLRASTKRDLNGRIKFGIDPAGDGDDEAAGIGRDHFRAKTLFLEKRSTPKSIASSALDCMRPLEIPGYDTWVDNFGEGANVAQEIALSDMENPIRVNGVNVGQDAEDKEMFFDKRAEIAWRMRTWIKAGGEFVDLDKWKEELLSLRYRRTAGKISKIQLMPKKIMKKLLLNRGKSPNRVDGLMLTFWEDDDFTKKPTNQPRKEHQPLTIFGG